MQHSWVQDWTEDARILTALGQIVGKCAGRDLAETGEAPRGSACLDPAQKLVKTGTALFTATQRERHTAKGMTVDMPNRKGNTKRVTLTDVARESGVAPSMVSIVLNEAPLSKKIADRTKEQIRSTAKRLGDRPDAFARSLRSRRSNAVGIRVFDLSDPFCSQILRGIEHALQSTGYLPIAMNANNDRGQLGGYFDLPRSRMTTLPRPDGCSCSTTI